MPEPGPEFSIITTCKGRLEHLRRSLPRLVSFEECEVIVVDYDCPQGTRDFVRAGFPAVKVVVVDDRPKFNASIARNLGARAATGKTMIFVDADIILAPEFLDEVRKIPDRGFGEFDFRNDARGTCAVGRKAFREVGGYDEVMQGYCGEDIDLYHRLHLMGYEPHKLPKTAVLEVIEHSNLERIANRGDGRKLSFARGKVYREIKSMLMRLELKVEIDLEFRKALWRRIDEIFHGQEVFGTGAYIEIPLPPVPSTPFIANCKIDRVLRITVKVDPV